MGSHSRWAQLKSRSGCRPFLHFGISLPSPDAVRRFRDRLADDGVTIVEAWDEPQYVSVKCLDPDGYVVEAAWEPHR
jgi:catechol 2,3-dioxygenase-like lactoylglutathione lyase family enzyme